MGNKKARNLFFVGMTSMFALTCAVNAKTVDATQTLILSKDIIKPGTFVIGNTLMDVANEITLNDIIMATPSQVSERQIYYKGSDGWYVYLPEIKKMTTSEEKGLTSFTISKLNDAALEEVYAGLAQTTFKATYASVLNKTTETVSISDRAQIEKAIETYDQLLSSDQVALVSERTLLDSLLLKVEQLEEKAAEDFNKKYESVLALTTVSVKEENESIITSAINEYKAASKEVQVLLTTSYDKLTDLRQAILELKAPTAAVQAADAYKASSAYTAVTQTVDNISVADEATVNTALEAYNALGSDTKTLLQTEKEKLDALKSRVAELKKVEEYTKKYATVLAKTPSNVKISDKTEVENAMNAFKALSQNLQDIMNGKTTSSYSGNDYTYLASLESAIKTAEETAKTTADSFKTTQKEVLALTLSTVKKEDESAIRSAISAYDVAVTTDGVKELLASEKTKLDSLLVKSLELKDQESADEAAAFRKTHAVILAKTTSTIQISDKAMVAVAKTAFDNLNGSETQDILKAEGELITKLANQITGLEIAKAFKENSKDDATTAGAKEALALSVSTVKLSDKTIVDTAIDTTYAAITNTVAQELLKNEKAKLDSLREKLVELEKSATTASDAFKSNNEEFLDKLATASVNANGTIVAGSLTKEDDSKLRAIISAYNALSADAKLKLTAEKLSIDTGRRVMLRLTSTNESVKALVETYINTNSTILSKTTSNVALTDKTILADAYGAYNASGSEVKAMLAVEKEMLDTLDAKMKELDKAAAEAYRTGTTYKAVKELTTTNVKLTDRTALDAAISAYVALTGDTNLDGIIKGEEVAATVNVANLSKEAAHLNGLNAKLKQLETNDAFLAVNGKYKLSLNTKTVSITAIDSAPAFSTLTDYTVAYSIPTTNGITINPSSGLINVTSNPSTATKLTVTATITRGKGSTTLTLAVTIGTDGSVTLVA